LRSLIDFPEGAQHACGFQTLVIVQPADDELGADEVLGKWREHGKLQDFTTYALMLQCILAVDGIHITASLVQGAASIL
jgi:hypothetical protein